MPGVGPKKRRVCAPESKRKCGPRLKHAAGPRPRQTVAQKKSIGNARKKRLGAALRMKRAAWPRKRLGVWLRKHWNGRRRKKKLAGWLQKTPVARRKRKPSGARRPTRTRACAPKLRSVKEMKKRPGSALSWRLEFVPRSKQRFARKKRLTMNLRLRRKPTKKKNSRRV